MTIEIRKIDAQDYNIYNEFHFLEPIQKSNFFFSDRNSESRKAPGD